MILYIAEATERQERLDVDKTAVVLLTLSWVKREMKRGKG
jgi:hypothetical protein